MSSRLAREVAHARITGEIQLIDGLTVLDGPEAGNTVLLAAATMRTCPVCHEPCLWPDTLCACCRRYSSDPHHVCEATVLVERLSAAMKACECCIEDVCTHDVEYADATNAMKAYVARRRDAQGEANDASD